MSDRSSLSAQVRAAAARHAGSLDELEALLLLQREPSRSWTATAMAQSLGMSERVARTHLERMRTVGVAVEAPANPSAFRYAEANPHRTSVELLAQAYATQRVALVNHVASAALSRMRAFADAFRLRKGAPNGD